ncbi:CP12 domain-containing protein, partial [Staphylococcus aureus]|uniref:CP12 domain-containing protein n=1 Tax=Staphylococcus aureus TaxID=1280 RepID=UPI0038B339D1
MKPAAAAGVISFGMGSGSGRMRMIRPVLAAPDKLSEKVAESIKEAEQACSEDPASGECVAAWDEVEELSA